MDPCASVYAIEGLQEAVVVLLDAVPEPAHEVLRLLLEADGDQGVEGEGGVPEPGIAVVPVALATDPLGQAHRRRGYQGARWIVDQQLQHERRATVDLAPPSVIGATRDPTPPVLKGQGQGLVKASLRERLSRP